MARSLLVLCSTLVLGACASAPPPVVVVPDEEAINALYRVIDSSIGGYEVGLDALRAGYAEEGRLEMDRAVAALNAAGSRCAEQAGCEPQRFMAAYGNLLTLRSDVLAGAAEGFVEVEQPTAERSGLLADMPAAAASVNLLNGDDLREIIALNGPVKAALHDWLTWMRPTLIEAWEHYQYMRHLMWPVYEEAGLPEALLFGILAKESGGRVHAVSRAGAAGPLQFMPHTGQRFGLARQNGFDQRFDPTLSTRANVAYLNERFAELNNNLELALAAYNGGEGRVLRLARRSGQANFWNPELRAQLPRETQDYVPYVLAAAWLFLHPEDYGLEFPQLPDVTPARVTLPEPMTLGEITVCLGQSGSRSGWFRTLRNLNPRHEPFERLPAGAEVALPAKLVSVFEGQCVAGELAAIAARLHESRDERRPASRIYMVQAGDTLSTIARRNGCPNVQTIARENNISAPRFMIRPGQRLTLTGCRG
jgi:membrane-bound lytic murein transglycosylase D